mgnify:CR=1 FL=1
MSVVNFRFSVAYRYEVLRKIEKRKTVKIYQPLGKQIENTKEKLEADTDQEVWIIPYDRKFCWIISTDRFFSYFDLLGDLLVYFDFNWKFCSLFFSIFLRRNFVKFLHILRSIFFLKYFDLFFTEFFNFFGLLRRNFCKHFLIVWGRFFIAILRPFTIDFFEFFFEIFLGENFDIETDSMQKL